MMKCGCVHHDSWECGFRQQSLQIFCNCICHQLPRLGEPCEKLPGSPDWWKTVEWRPGRWDPMSNAPHGCGQEIRGRGHDGVIFESMHWACDLSGDEQPPFRGWFISDTDRRGFSQVMPVEWQPTSAAPTVLEVANG